MVQQSPDILGGKQGNRRLTTVMAIDVCGYSALSERDEQKAIQVVQRVSAILDRVTQKYKGRRFHKAGDGFLVEFQTASDNLNAALEITEDIRSDSDLQILEPTVCRIGLHAGEVTEQQDGDLLGHGVNIAARLQGEADEGGILASSNFMNLVSRDFTGRKRRRGFLALKNISEPVEAFDIEGAVGRWARLIKQGQRFLKRNSIALGLFLVAMCAIGLLFHSTIRSAQMNELQKRVDSLLERGLQGSDGYSINPVDSAYMRGMLGRLAASGKTSDKASFAMLEAGNIDGAIAILTEAMGEISPEDSDYLTNLHQIGALAMHHDASRAAAIFETILLKDPRDADAMVFLGHSNVGVERSEVLWRRAVQTGRLSEEQRLQVKIDLAYNNLILGNPSRALEELLALEPEIKALNKTYLTESYHSDRGMILERLDRLIEAEADLLYAIDLQKKFGYDYNTERAYNVLGFIAMKRAETPRVSDRDIYLGQAEAYFRLQYEAATRIAKRRSQAEALYFLGDVELQRGNINRAERDFLQSFTISREGAFGVYEFLARVGLAQVEAIQGDRAAACGMLEDALDVRVTSERSEVDIGPRTQSRIDSIGCNIP